MLTYTNFLFSKSSYIGYIIFVLSFSIVMILNRGFNLKNVSRSLLISSTFAIIPFSIASHVMYKDYRHAYEVCKSKSELGYKMIGKSCYMPYNGYIKYDTDELPEG